LSFPESRSEFLSTTKRIGDVGERFSEPEWRLGGPIENSGKKLKVQVLNENVQFRLKRKLKINKMGLKGVRGLLKLKKSSTQNVLQHDRLEIPLKKPNTNSSLHVGKSTYVVVTLEFKMWVNTKKK
jgi:hypothetical protein